MMLLVVEFEAGANVRPTINNNMLAFFNRLV
jgi:hypothetical protein